MEWIPLRINFTFSINWSILAILLLKFLHNKMGISTSGARGRRDREGGDMIYQFTEDDYTLIAVMDYDQQHRVGLS